MEGIYDRVGHLWYTSRDYHCIRFQYGISSSESQEYPESLLEKGTEQPDNEASNEGELEFVGTDNHHLASQTAHCVTGNLPTHQLSPHSLNTLRSIFSKVRVMCIQTLPEERVILRRGL